MRLLSMELEGLGNWGTVAFQGFGARKCSPLTETSSFETCFNLDLPQALSLIEQIMSTVIVRK